MRPLFRAVLRSSRSGSWLLRLLASPTSRESMRIHGARKEEFPEDFFFNETTTTETSPRLKSILEEARYDWLPETACAGFYPPVWAGPACRMAGTSDYS